MWLKDKAGDIFVKRLKQEQPLIKDPESDGW